MSPAPGVLVVLLAVLSVAGCSFLPFADGGEPATPSWERYWDEGVWALEAGDHAGAEDRFRRIAASCRSGPLGRRALLLLSALALDPDHARGDVGEAARLSAVFLSLPDAPEDQRAVARTLYLSALDRGAAAVDSAAWVGALRRPQPEANVAPAAALPPAPRFDDCVDDPEEPTARVVWRGVPIHPGPTAAQRLAGAESQAGEREIVTRILQARVDSLQAELARIRRILSGGRGGSGGGPIPR